MQGLLLAVPPFYPASKIPCGSKVMRSSYAIFHMVEEPSEAYALR